MIAQFGVENQISHQHFVPRFANAKAKAVWNRAVTSFDQGYPLDFIVSGSTGTYRVLIDRDRVRQDSTAGVVAYSGKKVQIKSKTGTHNAPHPKVSLPTLASKAGLTLDPGIRAWAFDLNPMERLVNPGTVIRQSGAMRVAGVSCDLLEMSSPGLKMNLVLRHSDGLPLRIWSEVKDQKGIVLSSSERKFSYVSIRKPIPAKRFSL